MQRDDSGADARVAALVRAGKIRGALFLPPYVKDEASGALRGLDDAYGVNRVGIAIRKGDAGLLASISAFVEEIKASGFVERLVESEQLRGFRVAKRG